MTPAMETQMMEPDLGIEKVEFAGLKLVFAEHQEGVGVWEDGEWVGAIDEKTFKKRMKRAADDFTTSPSTTHWLMFGSTLWCDNEEEYAVMDEDGNTLTTEEDIAELEECPKCGEEL